MSLPELTLACVTYKRPWYAILTIDALVHKIQYDGDKRFIVSDGGSSQEELDAYDQRLQGTKHEIVVTDNLSDMMNAVAKHAGEFWFVTLDDFTPIRRINLSPDVRMLMQYPDVGAVRMGRLAFWGLPPNNCIIKAEMIETGGLHWWKIDKAQTTDPYICSIGSTVYHRRFWDAYGDIDPCPPDLPGQGELNGCARYNTKPGPTVAIPMRFGEDCGEWSEPIEHRGMWRTDSYAKAGGGKRL